MRILFLVFISILVFSSNSFGQAVDVSGIEEAKSKLERLQKELWKIDLEQLRELEKLEQQSIQKGEFETTKQFEERIDKLQQQTDEIRSQIFGKEGLRRKELHKQMNEIFRTEFSGETIVSLGKYDADSQRFILSSNDGIEFGYLSVPLSDAQELKENFSAAKTSGVLGLLLNRENVSQEYILTAKISFRGKIYQAISNSLTESKAMQMVFGNYEPASKTSFWKTYKIDENIENERYIEKYKLSSVKASVLYFKGYKENNIDKYLLISITPVNGEGYGVLDSFRPAGGIPSIVVFIKKNGYWKIEMAQKHTGEWGPFGYPGEPTLVTVGSNKSAIKFSRATDRCDEGEAFWRIDDEDFLKPILSIYNGNICGEREESHSTVTFVPSSNAEFFDAKVTTVGVKAVKVGRKYTWKPFTKIEIYTFKNGKYQLIEK